MMNRLEQISAVNTVSTVNEPNRREAFRIPLNVAEWVDADILRRGSSRRWKRWTGQIRSCRITWKRIRISARKICFAFWFLLTQRACWNQRRSLAPFTVRTGCEIFGKGRGRRRKRSENSARKTARCSSGASCRSWSAQSNTSLNWVTCVSPPGCANCWSTLPFLDLARHMDRAAQGA